jgi:type IV secretory pathway VirD2 relaxase
MPGLHHRRLAVARPKAGHAGTRTGNRSRAQIQAGKRDYRRARFTRIDRAMLGEAKDGVLDLRPEAGQVKAESDRTLRIGRLQILGRYGLANEAEPKIWVLSDRLEPTLREVGERGDIIKAINRALSARGQERDLGSYVLHAETVAAPVVGRIIHKRLTGELGDRVSLVIDGLDGRVHHVMLPDAGSAEQANLGAIVEVGRAPSQRPADRTIAELARGTGEYQPSIHRDLV